MAEASSKSGFDFGGLLSGVGNALSGTAAGLQGDNDYFGRLQAQMDNAAERRRRTELAEQELKSREEDRVVQRGKNMMDTLKMASEMAAEADGDPEKAKLLSRVFKPLLERGLEGAKIDDTEMQEFFAKGAGSFDAIAGLYEGIAQSGMLKDPATRKALKNKTISLKDADAMGKTKLSEVAYAAASELAREDPEGVKKMTRDEFNKHIPHGKFTTDEQFNRLSEVGYTIKSDAVLKKEKEGAVETAAQKGAMERAEFTSGEADKRQMIGLQNVSANTAAQIAASERGRVESEDRRRKADEDRETSRRLQNESRMRKEFTSQSKPFIDMVDTKKKIEASAKDPSAAGDLSMIFAYMKMLDPISVVREGEQATAASARGVPDSVRNIYNRVVTGQRLTPTQRKDFVDRAGKLFDAGKSTHTQRVQEFRRTATASEIDPEKVIIDFEGQPSGAPSQSEIEAAKKRLGITK